MKRFAKHLPHYLSLIGILFAGLVGLYFFSYDKLFQAGVASAMAMGYVAWGVIHHSIHRDLSLSVVIEYIMVASLGLVVVFSLLFTA